MCKERRIYSFESENRIYGMKKSLEFIRGKDWLAHHDDRKLRTVSL